MTLNLRPSQSLMQYARHWMSRMLILTPSHEAQGYLVTRVEVTDELVKVAIGTLSARE
jgi:hypothetical protein